MKTKPVYSRMDGDGFIVTDGENILARITVTDAHPDAAHMCEWWLHVAGTTIGPFAERSDAIAGYRAWRKNEQPT